MRIFLFLFLSLGALFSAEAQQVATYFAAMPAELLPQIDINRRKDMIDFYRETPQSSITNGLGGRSDITAMTDDCLSIALSPVSSMQLKLLPGREGSNPVLAVVHTVCAPACDSRIDFYDTDWTPLDGNSCFRAPADADFLSAAAAADSQAAEAIQTIDILLMRYDFVPGSTDLRVTSTWADYMPGEIYATIQPFLRESLVYRWDGTRFVKEP